MPTVDVDGQPVSYARVGDGPALLLVHGSGGDHTVWGRQLQGLKTRFTVAALDLNGHGKSAHRDGDALIAYAADVQAVMDELDRPTVVMGHSLGGAVAQALALQRPDNLRGIGLIGTGGKLRVHPDLLATIDRDLDEAAEVLARWLFSESASDDLREKARAQMTANGQAELARDFRACDAFDVMDRLGEIDVPALVTVGENDRMTPVKYSEHLREAIPNAYLRVIEGAGHMVMLERPEALNDAIVEFMTRLEGD